MFDETKLAAQNGVSSTVSIKDWLLLDCIAFLNLIPVLGSIAAIIIYLIIAFGSSTSLSMKNRVLASIVWIVIWIIITLIFLFVFGGLALITNTVNKYY